MVGFAAAARVIRPRGLDREGAVAGGQVERPALGPGRDPGALVAVLRAEPVGPAASRVLVRAGLGVLVTLDDRDAVERAVAVDEVLPARGAGVGDVGQVGERDIPVGGGHAAAAEGGVAVVVVPGAEPLGLVVVGVGAVRGDDDVLGVAVGGGGGVAEVGRRVDRLDTELMA